jgi:hypothetical protein
MLKPTDHRQIALWYVVSSNDDAPLQRPVEDARIARIYPRFTRLAVGTSGSALTRE